MKTLGRHLTPSPPPPPQTPKDTPSPWKVSGTTPALRCSDGRDNAFKIRFLRTNSIRGTVSGVHKFHSSWEQSLAPPLCAPRGDRGIEGGRETSDAACQRRERGWPGAVSSHLQLFDVCGLCPRSRALDRRQAGSDCCLRLLHPLQTLGHAFMGLQQFLNLGRQKKTRLRARISPPERATLPRGSAAGPRALQSSLGYSRSQACYSCHFRSSLHRPSAVLKCSHHALHHAFSCCPPAQIKHKTISLPDDVIQRFQPLLKAKADFPASFPEAALPRPRPQNVTLLKTCPPPPQNLSPAISPSVPH